MTARPLPVRESTKKNGKAKSGTRSAGKANIKQGQYQYAVKAGNASGNDTPKAFQRLMMVQAARVPTASGHNGKRGVQQKKRKRIENDDDDDEDEKDGDVVPASGKNRLNGQRRQSQSGNAVPTIMPGERLADFSARVDQAMPLSGLKRSGKPVSSSEVIQIREQQRTKHERRLRRLQQQWRKEEAAIQEREAAEREEREAEMEEQLALWKEWEIEAGEGNAKSKKNKTTTPKTMNKKKGKKKHTGGTANDDFGPGGDDDEADPWAKLNNNWDRLNKPANPFEVALAPPQLMKPKEVFKVRGGATVDVANVPSTAGSLRRREELAGERRTIVEEYRRLMAEKKQ